MLVKTKRFLKAGAKARPTQPLMHVPLTPHLIHSASRFAVVPRFAKVPKFAMVPRFANVPKFAKVPKF